MPYMAPEIVQNGELYDQRVDIWAAGVVLFFMVHGYLPFNYNCMSRD